MNHRLPLRHQQEQRLRLRHHLLPPTLRLKLLLLILASSKFQVLRKFEHKTLLV
jgi:hypothetical protein